jgi:hypothetical protein
MRRAAMWTLAERAAWALGLVCLAGWLALTWWGSASARAEIDRFESQKGAHAFETAAPDLSLWSKVRIDAWRETLSEQKPAALAVLRIPSLHLEAPVLEAPTNGRSTGVSDTSPTRPRLAPPATPASRDIATGSSAG